jgi:hypothetical protein
MQRNQPAAAYRERLAIDLAATYEPVVRIVSGNVYVAPSNTSYFVTVPADQEIARLRRENEQLKKQAKCSHGPWADNNTYCTSCGFYDASRAQ